MTERDWLARQFEEQRGQLREVAHRILGSASEAEDALQEAWIRVSRAEAEVRNLGGWLTTSVTRVCLDMLRTRRSHERKLPEADLGMGPDTEAAVLMADSVGPALLVVLETLAPTERVAFVLHDVFDLPFEEIGPMISRSAVATRQLASRARRRIQGGSSEVEADSRRQREVVDAFMAASREGRFDELLALLDPEVVVRADEVAVQTAAANQAAGAPLISAESRGPIAVAQAFSGRARGAVPVLIDGIPGSAWLHQGKPRAAFAFTVADGKVLEIDIVMDPARLGALEIAVKSRASGD